MNNTKLFTMILLTSLLFSGCESEKERKKREQAERIKRTIEFHQKWEEEARKEIAMAKLQEEQKLKEQKLKEQQNKAN